MQPLLTLPGSLQKVLSMPRHSASWHYPTQKYNLRRIYYQLASSKYVYRELT